MTVRAEKPIVMFLSVPNTRLPYLDRPFQEVNLEPLVEADLPNLEHLELHAQNEAGFGSQMLQPLARAKLPKLRYSCRETQADCTLLLAFVRE